MQATQNVPATTFSGPRLGKAAVVALAAAILGGVLAVQGPWAVTSGNGTLSEAGANAALIQVRAGERESLGLGQKADGANDRERGPGGRGKIPS